MPRLMVSPLTGLRDRPLRIAVEDCTPGERLKFDARTTEPHGSKWSAQVKCTADERGTVELDGLELLSSLRSERNPRRHWPVESAQPLRVELAVQSESGWNEAAQIVRLAVPADRTVQRRKIAWGGVEGVLYTPLLEEACPVLLVLAEDGRLDEAAAALIASHGLAAFALAWWESIPLVNRPEPTRLEIVLQGLAWLKNQPGIDFQRIGVAGAGKAAELALLLASRFPQEFSLAAAFSPSAIITPAPPQYPGARYTPAWSLSGIALPYLKPRHSFITLLKALLGFSVIYRTGWERALEHPSEAFLARIAVEKINGPVFLAVGQKDSCQPTELYADWIAARMAACGREGDLTRMDMPEMGYFERFASPPGMPAADDLHGQMRAWAEFLAFLERVGWLNK